MFMLKSCVPFVDPEEMEKAAMTYPFSSDGYSRHQRMKNSAKIKVINN